MSKKEWHVERGLNPFSLGGPEFLWRLRDEKAGSSCGPSRKTHGARLATLPASTGAALSSTERTGP